MFGNLSSSFGLGSDPSAPRRYGGRVPAQSTLPVNIRGGDLFHLYGNGTIDRLPAAARDHVIVAVVLSGYTPVLANSASLVVNTGASKTLAGGDLVIFVSMGSGVWNAYVFGAGIGYFPASTADRLYGTDDSGNASLITLPAAGLALAGSALALANDLAALEALGSTGFAVRSAANTWVQRQLAAPAAGITIGNPDGVSGNPTLALANDLAALEGLGSTGIAVRSASDTWVQRQLAAPAAGITITNPDGVAGNPTLALANDLAGLEGLAGKGTPRRNANGTWTLAPAPSVPQRNYLAGATWLASTSSGDLTWQSVAWSAELGLFCAVANDGAGSTVMTSPDGITWTARTPSSNAAWAAVVWAAELGLFVAIGGTASGMTSPDGITWTARTLPTASTSWNALVWAPELGLLVACGSNTTSGVATSPDGITWTARTTASRSHQGIAWAPEIGLLVAVAGSGTGTRVETSPDGITWTLQTTPNDFGWAAVAWSPTLSLFVAIASSGTGNRVMSSPDGVTWTARAASDDTKAWRSVKWAPEIGLFVAVGSAASTANIMYSADGVTWTAATGPNTNTWFGLSWSPQLGLFAAVAQTGAGNRAMTSVSMFKYPYRS